MDARQLQKYWQGFISYMNIHYPQYKQRSASKNNRQIVPPHWFGGDIRVAAGINWDKENSIQVDVTLKDASKEITKEWYGFLMTDERTIRKELVTTTDEKWCPDIRLDKPESWIVLKIHSHPEERNWNEQYQWLAKNVDKFHKVFEPKINKLLLSSSNL